VISIRTLRHLLVLTRPHNCLIAALSVTVGAFMAIRGLSAPSIFASVTAFFVCAGAYALNDYFDVGTDRVNKPYRPYASGTLKPQVVIGAVVAFWTAGLACALLAGWRATLFLIVWVVLLYLYSWRLKSYGLAGHLVVSLVASSGFILGGWLGEDPGVTVAPFAIAILLHLTREIVKSVADMAGDEQAGISTLALRIGPVRTLRLALWCVVGLMVASLLPFVTRVFGYAYFIPVAVVIYPILIVCARLIVLAGRGSRRIEQSSIIIARALKLVMPVGLVAFFLAGIELV
jgi:geranylgeranylglycerol-phosphate geranylgeranyltransferase